MSQISIEGFYPLLILGAGALIRILQKKAKEKRDREADTRRPPPSSPIILREVSPPTELPVKTLAFPQVKMPMNSLRKKKKPRIAKLISGLKHKQDLILLSEILVNKRSIK